MAMTLEVKREGTSLAVSGCSTSRRWFSSAKHSCHLLCEDYHSNSASSVSHYPNAKPALLHSFEKRDVILEQDPRARLLGLTEQGKWPWQVINSCAPVSPSVK